MMVEHERWTKSLRKGVSSQGPARAKRGYVTTGYVALRQIPRAASGATPALCRIKTDDGGGPRVVSQVQHYDITLRT